MNDRSYEYFKWGMAITATLFWHILIWSRVASPGDVAAGFSTPRSPRLSYLPVTADGGFAGTMAGDLITPVLFSLPSSFGFSHSVVDRGDGLMRDFDSDLDDIALLDSPIVKRGWEMISWPRHMDRQVATLLDNPILNRPRQALKPGLKLLAENPLMIHVAGPAAAVEFVARNIELDSSVEPAGPWQALLNVHFDSSGMPRQIFMDSSSGSEMLDRAIILQLNRWRVDPSEGPVSGEVRLQRN